MTTIYFVRHGTSDFTVKDDFTRPLTEQGEQDAEKLVNGLDACNIKTIYSSPYIRSQQTILPFSKKNGIPIEENIHLRERHVGSWVEDFKSFSQKQWEDFHYKLPSGESLYETQTRNVDVIKKLIHKHVNESIIVSTHGTALCTILHFFDQQYDYNYFKHMMYRMPFVLKVTFEKERLIAVEEIVV